MAKSNETWAVVVIHGVGFTQVGATLERFFRGVCENRRLSPVGGPEIHLLEHANITEGRFPMYMRRAKTQGEQPILFAEVYWGDISKSEGGISHLLLRLLTIVFHLRYLIDCAAAYPCDGWMSRCQRITLWLASWILCGPLAAMYALLFLFMMLQMGKIALNWLFETLFPSVSYTGEPVTVWLADYELLTFSNIAIIVGAWLYWISNARRLTWGGTWRYLLAWFTIDAFVIAALSLRSLLWADTALQVTDIFPTCIKCASVALLVTILLVLLGLAWATVLMIIDWANAAAYSAAIGASMVQLALWSVIVPAFAMFLFALPNIGDRTMSWEVRDLFLTNSAILLLPLSALSLTGLLRIIRFRVLRSRTPGRLIVHWTTVLALAIATIVGGVLYINEFINRVAPDSPFVVVSLLDIRHQIGMRPWAAPITASLEVPWIQLSIVLGSVALATGFLYSARTLLHIVMDVISHFYRLHVYPMGTIDHNSHTLQKRITHRVHRVLAEMHAEGATRVTIVSHSQGTATAVIALARADLDAQFDPHGSPTNLEAHVRDWLRTVRVDLVTMGSPISHLYQHYFPDRYPPFYVREGGVSIRNLVWGNWVGLVHSWTNLYRYDDFVGTTIVGDGDFPHTFPKNIPLTALGGHTKYWDHVDVIENLDGVLPK